MDDSRIKQLTEEVLSKLGPSNDPVVSDLEARIAALEAAVRRLEGDPRASGTPASATLVVAQIGSAVHPSLHAFGPKSGSDHCCLEPDKPCVGSGQCRAFGH
jgi:hypothetical protein